MNTDRSRHLATAIAILTVLGGLLSPVAAQTGEPVVVRLGSAELRVAAGQTVDVALEVVDVEGLYAFDVTLTFDPDVVEVVDADPALPGVQVGQGTFLDSGFSVINAADNEAGIVQFVTTQLNPSEPKSGSGSLIVIRLRGKQPGASSPLTLAAPQLSRRDGSAIQATGSSGRVDVVTDTGPTNTPIPTQGAGTPMATLTPGRTVAAPTATPSPTSVPATITPLPMTFTPTAVTAEGGPAQPPMAQPVAMDSDMPSPAPAEPTRPGATASEDQAPAASTQPAARPTSAVEASAPTAVMTAPAATPAVAGQSTSATEPPEKLAIAPAPSASPASVAVGTIPAVSRQAEPSQASGASDRARLYLQLGIGVGGLAVAAALAAVILWLQGHR